MANARERVRPQNRPAPGRRGLWHTYTVRSALPSARISGQRAYAPDTRSDPAGGREILGPGDWGPIITAEETAQIRAILADPARRRATPAQPKAPASPELNSNARRAGYSTEAVTTGTSTMELSTRRGLDAAAHRRQLPRWPLRRPDRRQHAHAGIPAPGRWNLVGQRPCERS